MDLVDTVAKVVKVAMEIKKLVKTVQHNREHCKKIATNVERLRAIMACLADNPVANEITMIDTLNGLEESFLRALNLVKVCQTKNTTWRFVTARSISKQLLEVDAEINQHVNFATFCTVVQKQRVFIPSEKPPARSAYNRMGAQASSSADVTRSEIHGENESFSNESLEYTISRFKNYSSSDLKDLTNNFSNLIGIGGSAIVYKGVYCGGAEVAIKSFCIGESHDEYVARYAEVFSVLREHENVIKFLGYCHEIKIEMVPMGGKCVAAERHHMFVVEEYMPNGSLSEIIDGTSHQQQLDWPSVFRIIRGIAQGIAYIHTKGAVYLDLKPDNILLDYDMNPKICDFERSKVLNQEDEEVLGVVERVTQELVGKLSYLPPEYIADGIFSVKHDVFSFGVLLNHTITKMGLLQDSTYCIMHAIEGEDDVDGSLGLSSRDESEQKEIKRCMDIGTICVKMERTDRPTMSEVVDMLDGKKQPWETPLPNKAASFKKKGKALSHRF